VDRNRYFRKTTPHGGRGDIAETNTKKPTGVGNQRKATRQEGHGSTRREIKDSSPIGERVEHDGVGGEKEKGKGYEVERQEDVTMRKDSEEFSVSVKGAGDCDWGLRRKEGRR